ncbi:coiled-coil domain-containing protein 73 isoform X2 [Rhinoraja longicauda]
MESLGLPNCDETSRNMTRLVPFYLRQPSSLIPSGPVDPGPKQLGMGDVDFSHMKVGMMDNKTTGKLECSNTGLRITYDFQSPAPAVLCSVHQLEFKTSLLEVVEELHICRAAESRYEEQISKLVVEKQELEWQKESLQHQYNALSSQHEETIISLKKQFQTQVNAAEEEKVSKYNLEKKLSELEQKVRLQNIAKDNQFSQLSKVEKRFAAISHQYGLVVQTHGKLEQNVDEATRLNKKLMTVNKNQENAIHDLKQELEKVTADLIRSKVTSQYNLGKDNIHLTTQQQQLQELKQKLQMEIELNKMLSKDKSAVQEEKQEVLKLLQQTQQLLQRQELVLGRAEKELKHFGENRQVLERDNELLREKANENEDKFQSLERKNEKSTAQWKKEESRLNEENQQIKSELESLRKAHATCQEVDNNLAPQEEQRLQTEQNILQHPKPPTLEETSELQTRVSETLMITDSEMQLGIHSQILTEADEKSNGLDFNNQGNSYQDGMVTTDNTVKNSIEFSPDIAKQAAEMPGQATDNGAILVNEKECISLSTVDSNIEEPKVIHEGKTGSIFNETECASAELESQYSSICLAEVPVEGGKMLSDSADALGVCSADVGQQTDSIAHKFDGGKNDTNDKTETTQCDKGVLINEPLRTEARAALGSDEILTKEVIANEIRLDINQAQHHTVSDLDSQSVIKNEQSSILQQQQQQGCHSQAITIMEENCANNDTTRLSPLLNPCSKSEVSSTKLPTDQPDQSILSENCKDNTNVEPDSKIDISREISSDRETDITKGVGSNSENNFTNANGQQKETNDTEVLISDSKTAGCVDIIEPVAGALRNLEYLQGNVAQKKKCVNGNHSLNSTRNVDYGVVATPNSQVMEEVHNSATDSAVKVKSGQGAISKIGLCTAIREVGVSSKITENELKSVFINTALNPITIRDEDHRDETPTSEVDAASSKTTANHYYWKFQSLPSLVSSKGKDVSNKATMSLPFSLHRDKLEAPATGPFNIHFRKAPLTFTFPKSISEMNLTRPCVADSPSTKRVNDTFNTSSVPLYPKRISKEDWNAIAQTFCDFSRPPEQEKHCSPSSESFKMPCLPAFSSHQQPTAYCSQVPEVATQNLMFEDECDTQYSTVKGQIDKIERFLSVDRLKHTRKRKAPDDNADEGIIKTTPT